MYAKHNLMGGVATARTTICCEAGYRHLEECVRRTQCYNEINLRFGTVFSLFLISKSQPARQANRNQRE